MYSKTQTVLLDDPFSALDNTVAKKVFNGAIKKLLLGTGRTVVMVTSSQGKCGLFERHTLSLYNLLKSIFVYKPFESLFALSVFSIIYPGCLWFTSCPSFVFNLVTLLSSRALSHSFPLCLLPCYLPGAPLIVISICRLRQVGRSRCDNDGGRD